MILKNPLSNRLPPIPTIIIIWVTSSLLNVPTFFAMRVSEYFAPKKLIHCRIIGNLSSETVSIIRKYRVLELIIVQYVIPLMIAGILYGLCIKKILLRQRIGK